MAQNGDREAEARWQAAMIEAARGFAQRLVHSQVDGRRELRVSLLRAGFTLSETEAAVGGGRQLEPARRQAMRQALRRELDACRRRARAARIDYDLNRHIAVFRALRQLEESPTTPSPPPADRSRADIASRSSATTARVESSIRR